MVGILWVVDRVVQRHRPWIGGEESTVALAVVDRWVVAVHHIRTEEEVRRNTIPAAAVPAGNRHTDSSGPVEGMLLWTAHRDRDVIEVEVACHNSVDMQRVRLHSMVQARADSGGVWGRFSVVYWADP